MQSDWFPVQTRDLGALNHVKPAYHRTKGSALTGQRHSQVVTNLLQEQQITRMDWSNRFSDLVPIDNLWDTLGRRVWENSPPPADVHQLLPLCQRKWFKMLQKTLTTLQQSMRTLCQECLIAHGGHTHN